ncbi:RES family NAD+ phosphorylase [Paucibacter sp. R3-3]|uniref:RES family NAD+ phosphorylase n=1 Tax=Roseateles agri TaxID=3098619 RepID=A0ABU5DES6_9BURK|nr:RES family NAD+ phosphorylase [Paucibacter sp. R3-3]MDY0744772.1 RES family NAD+ phosphorylase [Paucibacter sp. R3-3]
MAPTEHSVHADESEEADKLICSQCVGEAFLSNVIEQSGFKMTCSYCSERGPCWSIEGLAESIEKAFEDHYVRTSTSPESWQERLQADKESDYEWEREGYPVVDAIEGAASIPREAAEDVLERLANKYARYDKDYVGVETEFSAGSYYEEKGVDPGGWQREWRWFERSLKSEARFFSKAAAGHLSSVFGGIDKIRTRGGRGIVVNAGPGRGIKRLYRARVFLSDNRLEEALCRPDIHLGSPPGRIASSGRMNARGISVFYGATAPGAAIAEVRPPVGSKVAVAQFEIVLPLRLLDLTTIEQAEVFGSIFDPSFKNRLERVAFLQSLGQMMTRPVMPDDEALDYLATQAVADFLATENEPPLDGIIYRSVQTRGGRNVVLFHKAARVAELQLPNGTTVSARSFIDSDDGPEVDYWVWEEVPKESGSKTPTKDQFLHDILFSDYPSESGWDDREPALRVDPASVSVHWIDWVSVRSTKHDVARHRVVKPDPSQEPKF